MRITMTWLRSGAAQAMAFAERPGSADRRGHRDGPDRGRGRAARPDRLQQARGAHTAGDRDGPAQPAGVRLGPDPGSARGHGAEQVPGHVRVRDDAARPRTGFPVIDACSPGPLSGRSSWRAGSRTRAAPTRCWSPRSSRRPSARSLATPDPRRCPASGRPTRATTGPRAGRPAGPGQGPIVGVVRSPWFTDISGRPGQRDPLAGPVRAAPGQHAGHHPPGLRQRAGAAGRRAPPRFRGSGPTWPG